MLKPRAQGSGRGALEYDVKRRSGLDQLLSKFLLLSLLATTVNQQGAHPAKVVIPERGVWAGAILKFHQGFQLITTPKQAQSITVVAHHPTHLRKPKMTNFPITLRWHAIIMITAISGAATRPLRIADR